MTVILSRKYETMERNDFIEKFLGGIFALISVLAAFTEVALNEFSMASIAGGIKDIFATLTVVILFFAVAKDIVPKWKFEDKLKATLENWQTENGNMIVRNVVHDIEHKDAAPSCFSLDLKTNIVDFYTEKATTQKTGIFLRMPMLNRENYSSEGVKIKFYLNKGTFFSGVPGDVILTDRYQVLNDLFSGLINSKHRDFAVAGGTGQEITVELKRAVTTMADIKELIAVINTMYTAYLVSANLEK